MTLQDTWFSRCTWPDARSGYDLDLDNKSGPPIFITDSTTATDARELIRR